MVPFQADVDVHHVDVDACLNSSPTSPFTASMQPLKCLGDHFSSNRSGPENVESCICQVHSIIFLS